MTKNAIALYGLGTMGSSLAKNLIRNGVKTSLYSKSEQERRNFSTQEKNWDMFEGEELFIESLARPRIVLLMITSGKPVDLVIESLLPFLEEGDLLIDGGNSFYEDTNRRVEYLKNKNINFMGVGVSGGEKGALMGPSMMAGGSKEGWEICKDLLKLIAAKHNNGSCCEYVGDAGAGHYVKMVHNGIEYGLLQLIADIYHIMKDSLGMQHKEIVHEFKQWRRGNLAGYLLDITCDVLSKYDEETGAPLIDLILDVAGQKGTGNWTLLEGIKRGIYIPTITEAVFSRYFSQYKDLRQRGKQALPENTQTYPFCSPQELEKALYCGFICTYSQGIELIRAGFQHMGWKTDLCKVIDIWKEGCIIRAELLSDIQDAVREGNENIIMSEAFRNKFSEYLPAWRNVCMTAIASGSAVPALQTTISYYDYHRTDKMPINLVQGLRDCFGAHTYERIDKEGKFHTDWNI